MSYERLAYNPPVGLYVFHCVLIASAAIFFAAFGVYSLARAGEAPIYRLMAVGSLIVAAAVLAYLVYFIRKLVRARRAGEIR